MKNWHTILLVLVVALAASYWSKPGKSLISKLGIKGGN